MYETVFTVRFLNETEKDIPKREDVAGALSMCAEVVFNDMTVEYRMGRTVPEGMKLPEPQGPFMDGIIKES